MTRYSKGVRFEYETKKLFEKHGWFCIRSAGSRKIDLVCFKNGNVVAIECKRNWGEYVDEIRRYSKKSEKMGFPIFLIHKNMLGLSVMKIQPRVFSVVNFEKLLKGDLQ